MRIHIVPSEEAVWSEVQNLKGSTDFFEAQGDAHGEIDGNLQDAIEGLLVPVVGPWEQSNVWFHNQDFYGDGVRCLTFCAGKFPWQTVASLQKLLVEDCSRFSIVVHISDTLEADSVWVGTMGILQHEVVVTPYIAEMLQLHADVET